MTRRANWAGNLRYRAVHLHRPETLDDLQALVRSTPRLKVVGSRHSFSDLADTDGDHVSLDGLPRIVDVDADDLAVTVDGAIRYGDLAPDLHDAGFALHNLASLPHISIAGACATATHGSGDRSGNLATAVRSMELIDGRGEWLALDRDHDADTLAGAVVHLGALGIVTRMTLDIEPTYRVRQDVYEHLPFSAIADRFDEISAAAEAVSLFTTWSGPTVDQLWLKRRVAIDAPPFNPPATIFDAVRATRAHHPVPTMSAESTTDQLGVIGPWHERIPHFRMDHTPSAGDELQSEYFVARPDAPAALAAIDAIRDRVGPLVQTSEIRTVASDDLWLSMAYERDSVGIHFTWQPDGPAVHAILPIVEAALAPFAPRPHWAKLSTLDADHLASVYPRLPAFQALRDRFDPERRFANDYLARTVG